MAQEVAPFGIGITLVEPGPTRTSFGTGLVSPAPIAAYDGTPAGEVRRAVTSGSFPILGDAGKVVDAMIASADASQAPRRLALGSQAYASVRAGLLGRLAALDAQREVALSTDVDA